MEEAGQGLADSTNKVGRIYIFSPLSIRWQNYYPTKNF